MAETGIKNNRPNPVPSNCLTENENNQLIQMLIREQSYVGR